MADISGIPPTSAPFFAISASSRRGMIIQHVIDMIETTHRLTGMPREEIVRRGLIRKEISMCGLGGAAVIYDAYGNWVYPPY
jgi:hypothetical protein